MQNEEQVMVAKMCDVVKAVRRESDSCSPLLSSIDDAALHLLKPVNSY